MRVLLFNKKQKLYDKSGVGRAMKHQVKALTEAGIPFTVNEKDDFDIVHINTIDPSAFRMARKARRMGKKVVVHGHSTKEDFMNSFIFSNQIAPLFKIHLKRIYKLGHIIVTPTPYAKKLLDTYGLNREVVAISNGVDLARFKADNEDKIKKFREFFNLKPDQKVVMTVGLFLARKGLHDLIEIAKDRPAYTFIWFGHTPRAFLSRKIKKAIRNKPDNVIMPGYIAGDIIEGGFANADVFFFPSYEETEGIVVLEALASKCPLLIRDIPIYEEWLTHGVNCHKGKNNEEFKKLLDDIIAKKTPDTREAGYKVAQERDIKEIGKKLGEVYRRVLKK
ncbi:MAG: Processive diacylglycerol alpha-glucosyltransferase [Tenericutes bacterium ADurb.Bin239]|jgi:1,2-diacylglycerol-3-alpha-glucose alpha-1,2-glucosyltransferase|nr:MAG: Processive diacylglycerol alpha-glucosyltransferase [Tenericutes bacterium ADurb.Bin239]